MKKAIAWVMLMTALLLSGCGRQDTPPAAPTTPPEGAAMIPEVVEAPAVAEPSIDIDLTKMGKTSAYAYLVNILGAPDDYVGRRIRLKGIADESYLDETDTTYHYIVVTDASSCCAQGVEYVLSSQDASHPAPGAWFEISGIFERYEEDGTPYFHVVADEIDPA
ncbi:hypothetical protein ACH6CV_05230 [Bacillota bacterium Meth-B3]